MTTTNERQKQIKRLRELAQISKHKYLESGGDPHLSKNGAGKPCPLGRSLHRTSTGSVTVRLNFHKKYVILNLGLAT